MLWSTSPACTELETHVLDWLVPMLGLPEKFLSTGAGGGVIQDTASSASLCALLAARERATNFASNRKGCDGRLIAYCSTQTHSSLEKAIKIAGMGSDNLRHIEVDKNFAMRPEALARQIEQDIKAGLIPCFVCATVGTTSSNAIDPVREIAAHLPRPQSLAARGFRHERHGRALPGIPLHQRWRGIRRQLLLQPAQMDVHQLRLQLSSMSPTASTLIQTLSILPEYLRNQATESGAVIDYRDWHIQLGAVFARSSSGS